MTQDVSVSVPARAQFVSILRTVISGVAARLDFPLDAMEDLKIAVDEACAQLLPLSPTSLSMRAIPAGSGVEVVVSADADVAQWPPDGAERSLTWQVLTALADEAAWERDADGPAVRITKYGVTA